MEQIDNYQLQADYFKQLHIIIPEIKACIHLENEDDIPFWDHQLQSVSPGEYHYITHSKSKNGDDTSGCEQCLKYIPYLNEHFFVCIDSDLRPYLEGEQLLPSQYVAQTHTYSWENHCCQSSNLKQRTADKGILFDFADFLDRLSSIVYLPLIYLIYYSKIDNTQWNITKFNHCIPSQVKRADLENNGTVILKHIRANIEVALSALNPSERDIINIKSNCQAKGLTPSNAYLHIQGHALYNLISYIGNLLYKRTSIKFSQVLNDFNINESYPEIEKAKHDLKIIMS